MCLHVHTHAHLTRPPKATCGNLSWRAKLTTSRCCRWWASQHVVAYLRPAPKTHCCRPGVGPSLLSNIFGQWIPTRSRRSLLNTDHYMARWATPGILVLKLITRGHERTEREMCVCVCVRPQRETDDGNVNQKIFRTAIIHVISAEFMVIWNLGSSERGLPN